MSSISNNTLSQEYYYQVTQNSATYAQTATSGSSNVDSTSGAPASSAVINTTAPSVDPNNPSSGLSGAHHRHGGHGGGAGGLQQLLQTVQNALSSSSASSTDPNQVITNALQQLFGGSGDGTATDGQGSDSSTLVGNAGTTQTVGSTGTTSSSSSSTSTDADSVDGSDANSPAQTLAQLLQGYGVSPQQFRSDVISALSGTGGSLNESLFQNFEPGSGVDAVA